MLATESMPAELRPPPQRAGHREPLLPNAVAAMLVFVATELMFFTGLISAFVITRAHIVGWPPPGQPRLPIETTAFNTLVLLASGVALYFAGRSFAKVGEQDRTRARCDVALGLATFFVLFQGYEWVRLIEFGLTVRSSTYGSFFYLIVGTHGLHAVAAVLGLLWARRRLIDGTLTAGAFGAVQVFWYFVVGLWPILYYLVYVS